MSQQQPQNYTILKCNECGHVWELSDEQNTQGTQFMYVGNCPFSANGQHCLTVIGNT